LGKSLDESDDETPASRILLGYKGIVSLQKIQITFTLNILNSIDSSTGSDSDDSGSQPTRKLKKLRNKSDDVSLINFIGFQ